MIIGNFKNIILRVLLVLVMIMSISGQKIPEEDARRQIAKLEEIMDKNLNCPITQEIPKHPVRLEGEGNFFYERAALTRWLENHGTSPTTRARNLQVADAGNDVEEIIRSFINLLSEIIYEEDEMKMKVYQDYFKVKSRAEIFAHFHEYIKDVGPILFPMASRNPIDFKLVFDYSPDLFFWLTNICLTLIYKSSCEVAKNSI